jgi:hypothetical protein
MTKHQSQFHPAAEAPFHLGPEWRQVWMAAYGEGEPLRFEAGEAELHLLRQGKLLKSPTNLQTCYFGLAGGPPDPEALATLPSAMLRGTGVRQVVIDYVEEASPLYEAARRWRDSHLVSMELFARTSLVDCTVGWDAFLASRGKSVHKYWKACARELAQGGPLRVEYFRGGPELSALLDEMFALEAAGWKGREGTAVLNSAADTRFYTELAHRAAQVGALRIALLREGEALRAYEYCIVSGGTVFAMKVAYDETSPKRSFGNCLAIAHIRDCMSEDFAVYDVLGNGLTIAEHKQRFCNRFKPIYRIRLFARTPAALALHALHRARPYAKALRDRLKGKAPA